LFRSKLDTAEVRFKLNYFRKLVLKPED
jgi:hypothetical protein